MGSLSIFLKTSISSKIQFKILQHKSKKLNCFPVIASPIGNLIVRDAQSAMNFSCYSKQFYFLYTSRYIDRQNSPIWFLNIILLSDFSAKLSERFAIRELHFERKLLEYWNLLSGCKIERCLLQSKTFLVSIFNINVKPRAFHKRLHLLWTWILKVKCKYLKFQSILEWQINRFFFFLYFSKSIVFRKCFFQILMENSQNWRSCKTNVK